MKTSAIVCSVAALSLVGLAPKQAVAGDGFATGLFGGLAVGTILGAAASGPRVYYAEPVYAPACYWMLGIPVWDEYRGTWVRPRIRVRD